VKYTVNIHSASSEYDIEGCTQLSSLYEAFIHILQLLCYPVS